MLTHEETDYLLHRTGRVDNSILMHNKETWDTCVAHIKKEEKVIVSYLDNNEGES